MSGPCLVTALTTTPPGFGVRLDPPPSPAGATGSGGELYFQGGEPNRRDYLSSLYNPR